MLHYIYSIHGIIKVDTDCEFPSQCRLSSTQTKTFRKFALPAMLSYFYCINTANLHESTFATYVALIFRGEFRIIFTNKHGQTKKSQNCYLIAQTICTLKNEVILWPLTSSKIIVLVAQPISTDGGPPAWAVDKRAELGWPSSRGKGWPAVCKSGPRLCSFTVLLHNVFYLFHF